jgi:hypothetical protein
MSSTTDPPVTDPIPRPRPASLEPTVANLRAGTASFRDTALSTLGSNLARKEASGGRWTQRAPRRRWGLLPRTASVSEAQ